MVELRKSKWETLGGLPIPAFYAETESSERPGQPPYTRGIHEQMYRSRLWTMRQYAGFSSAKETNERFRLLL
ncbi:MAG: methylmalonyl-CoA mutase family protein, partial [Candidatus Poseidoniaceae archaeon]